MSIPAGGAAAPPRYPDRTEAPGVRARSCSYHVAVGLVLLYAVTVRLIVLDVPFHATADGAGAFLGIHARNYVRLPGSVHRGIPVQSLGYAPEAPVTFYHSHPPLVPLSIAVVYQLLGEGDWQTRLPAALSSVGGTFAVYLLLRALGRPRAGVYAALLYAATPMVLYFGGQPEFMNPEFTLLCLLVFAAFVRFHRRPDAPSLTLLCAAFAAAAASDWPAFHTAPVVLLYSLATRPRRDWGWALAFGLFSAAAFVALYAHVALVAAQDWTWMAPHLRTRAGGGGFTASQWLAAAWRYNVEYHTLPVLVLSGLWILGQLVGGTIAHSRAVSNGPAGRPTLTADSMGWLVLLWATLHLAVGRQGAFRHVWWWWPLTPALALTAALALDDAVSRLVRRRLSPRPTAVALTVLLTCFAALTAWSTLPRLRNPAHTGEGMHYSGPLLGSAIRLAAPRPNSAVLLVSELPTPGVWFYADRPLKVDVWDVASFDRRLNDQTGDLPFGFTQRWPYRPVAAVFPKAYVPLAADLHAHLRSTYDTVAAPEHLAKHYMLFDLTRRRRRAAARAPRGRRTAGGGPPQIGSELCQR